MDECHFKRTEYEAQGKIVLYECERCNKKEGVVVVDLMGFKLKYSVDPKKIEKWIEYKIFASTANEALPTSGSTEGV